MNNILKLLTLLILNNLVFVSSIDNEDIFEELGKGPCALIHELKNCIAHPGCSYCVKQYYSEPNRCDTFHRLKNTGCGQDIFEPVDQNAATNVEPNKKPDNVTVHLLPGMTRNITITFSLLAHPIDLYYLMDFSGSMSGDKTTLISVADKLMKTIGNITDDYRLGLGSFVDKPTPNNELGANTDYLFKNRMPLTNSTGNFVNIVRQTEILSGGDDPEGTGEALLQVLVCKNEIGWRDNARRIIVVATDTLFHLAGDGAIAKITKPNDGMCHLNSTGDYTAALEQDYPSIDQIRLAIEANSAIAIFAVRNALKQEFYTRMVPTIKAASLASLEADSKNILELITKSYDDISSKVELQYTNTTTKELDIKFYSNCHGATETETNVCEKLPKSGTVKFVVSIDLSSCPKDSSDWNQKITVSPVGLPLSIDIDARLVCDI